MANFVNIPKELKTNASFCLWKLEKRSGKPTKIPYNPRTGQLAKTKGQRAMEKNIKKGDARYQNRYPFTQKIFCGECGSGFKRKVCYTGKLKYAV